MQILLTGRKDKSDGLQTSRKAKWNSIGGKYEGK